MREARSLQNKKIRVRRTIQRLRNAFKIMNLRNRLERLIREIGEQ